MSGSYYALNNQYNSILNKLANSSPSGVGTLDEVLTAGNSSSRNIILQVGLDGQVNTMTNGSIVLNNTDATTSTLSSNGLQVENNAQYTGNFSAGLLEMTYQDDTTLQTGIQMGADRLSTYLGLNLGGSIDYGELGRFLMSGGESGLLSWTNPIQSGYISIDAGRAGSDTITFPTPFSFACKSVMLTPQYRTLENPSFTGVVALVGTPNVNEFTYTWTTDPIALSGMFWFAFGV